MRLTHFGPCGLCSSLQDLSVYVANVDLTTPVRACGFMAVNESEEASLECIRELGFTDPCAQIWFYNTRKTREACFGECLVGLFESYHRQDGSLNDCLRCDEEMSGPIFKAVAGRTRRNSGLATAICRPCGTVRAVEHAYDAIIGG